MVLLALILIPALAAAVVWLLPQRARAVVLVGTALGHTVLAAMMWIQPGDQVLGGWLAEDALGRIVLTVVSVLFLAVSHYAVGFLRHERLRGGRAFSSCMLAFLSAASLVALSHHLAALWIGMETTTLSLAPLVFHRHDRRSLEAVWKYLVLSSVGIALALLGVFLLAMAQPSGATGGRPLVFEDLIAHARSLDPVWLRAAFVFILVGFGTKMGLAPMHAWKPDTYGEAPSLVGALMAGGLTSCAFLGVARVTAVAFAAGADDFVRPVLVGFGLFSLVIAAAFIIGQGDVKRMLAYSSVEHMGLLVLGLGLGGVGAYGAVLHTLNNGLAKGLMFLAVGNVVLATGTSSAGEMRGLLKVVPVSSVLLVAGMFAITGSPPFGLFISELAIFSAAVGQHRPFVAAAILVLLAIIFVGIALMILEIVQGVPNAERSAVEADTQLSEHRWLVVAPAALALAVLMLGVYIPGPLASALASAARALGGVAP